MRERPPGRPFGYQRWNHLFFAHWEVAAELVQATLPRGLFVDTYAGRAFVGIVPFFMQRIRLLGTPPLPWLSWFLELNVRTYVHDGNGRSGVWFYSLDCNQPLAVALARSRFCLPYFSARMSARETAGRVQYECLRRGVDGAAWRYDYAAHPEADSAREAVAGSLEQFLVERYALFSQDRHGALHEGLVHHAPYRIQLAAAGECSAAPAALAGFSLTGEPCSLLVAECVDVTVFPIRPLNRTTSESADARRRAQLP